MSLANSSSPYLGRDEMRLLATFTYLQSGNELGMRAALRAQPASTRMR